MRLRQELRERRVLSSDDGSPTLTGIRVPFLGSGIVVHDHHVSLSSTSPVALADAAGLVLTASVPWGARVPTSRPGLYMVSQSEDPAAGQGALTPRVSEERCAQWLTVCPWLTVGGRSVSPAELAANLARWWLPTAVVYVGLASRSLRTRVSQYYTTPLGAKKPHAGGNWLRTFSEVDLGSVWVHVAEVSVELGGDPVVAVRSAETLALRAFVGVVGPLVGVGHPEPVLPLPFANLELVQGGRRLRRFHGVAWRRPVVVS